MQQILNVIFIRNIQRSTSFMSLTELSANLMKAVADILDGSIRCNWIAHFLDRHSKPLDLPLECLENFLCFRNPVVECLVNRLRIAQKSDTTEGVVDILQVRELARGLTENSI